VTARWLHLGLVASGSLHVASFAVLGRWTVGEAAQPRVVILDFEPPPPVHASVAPPKLEPQAVATASVPAPHQPKTHAPRTTYSAAVTAPAEATTDVVLPAADHPSAPVDLTAFTLASGHGTSARTSSVAAPPRSLEQAPRPAPSVVPASNLSERPAPPALDAALRRNYPDAARRSAIEGSAVTIVRIERDGAVRSVRVVSETEPGFGAACRQTLLASRWSTAKDLHGHAVATEVRYTCRFKVD
jgi:outer membrane biosynthesis protein TonB